MPGLKQVQRDASISRNIEELAQCVYRGLLIHLAANVLAPSSDYTRSCLHVHCIAPVNTALLLHQLLKLNATIAQRHIVATLQPGDPRLALLIAQRHDAPLPPKA